ncbi:hypothetical protein [Herbaspirillum rubrisubalbicans]|uniref:MotA/TolQ/ExbB proton channel domain-containing protein n=1 Tax=Herbaspirillum rubrisubalbicans TaxID=80842 RepID=A0AAD0XG76_9BURK|nr:hypothetical protein [Herbaspirillum rubrisubalbicans]AYR23389.1 hypothetical protein RC54_05920 [Herbaspirillum rubrisubalbicans]
MKISKYWISQIVPLAIVGYGAFHFHEFLELAVKSNPALNMTILGAILLSAGVCLWRMWAFSREAKTVSRFEGTYQKTHDTHVAAEVLGRNKTYMAGMLKVVGDMRGPLTSRLNQATLHQEFEELKSSYAQMMALPQFLSGFMIALGLFGTFIGLLETLGATASFIAVVANSSGGDADGAIVGLIKGIQGPLAGMGTAFSASLFGLLGSLVTGAMVNGLQSLSHELVYGTRRLVEKILPVESEVEILAASDITPEQLIGVADRLLRYEKSAIELYVRSKQADMETRAQIKDVSLHMSSMLMTMEGMVEQLVPSGQAMEQQSQHMAELIYEMRRQNSLLASVPEVATGIETAVKEVQRTGSNVERVLSAVMVEKQQSVLMEGQLSQSHALLRNAVRELSDRQEATDGLLARIAEGAQKLPTLSQQLEEWSQLASGLIQANHSWLKGVQEINADHKIEVLAMLNKLEQEFGKLANLNAATVEQTNLMAEQLIKRPLSMPADANELMRKMTQSLAAFQAGQEELLREVWRRQAHADKEQPAVGAH